MIVKTFLRKYYLRKMIQNGLTIGKGCRILSNGKFSEPYLISIGDYVSIGSGVQIIPHDGAVWVLRNIYKNSKIDRFGRVIIGSNIFIGNNCIVLPDTIIHDNVIIGANSVVKGELSSNSVYAGSPAKYICSIDDYYKKHKDRFIESKGLSLEKKKNLILEIMK